MSQPGERTRLLERTQPQYIYQSSINRERQRRVKKFQCCLCAIFLSILLVVLIATIVYSIQQEIHIDNTTDTTTNDNNTVPTSIFILLSRTWPIPDASIENTTLDDEVWNEAIQTGIKGLNDKNEVEKNVPSLKLLSPSYKHQKVVSTSERGRNMSKIGFVEQYATKSYFSRFQSKQNLSKLCHRRYTSSSQYCGNNSIDCNRSEKYRSYNGSCNNLNNPYGVAYRPFRRSLPPDYSDGINQPRLSKDGSTLPSARTVSLIIHRPISKNDPKFSVMLAVWGQFLDHDITATALSQKSNGSTIACCDREILSPECFPVLLDPEDPYQKYNVSCIEFVRSAPAPTCCLGARQQLNQATAFIDGSVIYGNDEETANKLRDFVNGTMKVFTTEDGRTLLPPSEDAEDGCNRLEESKQGRYCFMTGDPRANENLHLTSMHLLWVRHHNKIASYLGKLNPHWSDEQIFQETRRIIAAQLQHITYKEFLPILLGDELMNKFNLHPLTTGYSTNYRDSINSDIANSFAAASFRFAHSIIPGMMKLLSPQNSTPEYIQMRKMLFNPFELYQPGKMDRALLGAMNTSIETSDPYFTEELKSHMFESIPEETRQSKTPEEVKQPKQCGLDLVSLNIQRGRDHGLPSYSHWRQHCGFNRPKDFTDLEHDIDPNSLEAIKAVYRNVDDIDLYSGALSEVPLDNSILGSTLTCSIMDQFYRLKHGDRFWYETYQKPQAFTLQQLNEIRKTTLASIICDNADNLDVIQAKVMEHLGSTNNYISCSKISRPNIELWKEHLYHLPLTRDESDINVLSDN